MSTVFSQDLDSVRDYYCRPRELHGRAQTIYQIWESGQAFDDSVTPSTYCPEYQRHVLEKLRSVAADSSSFFSLGCGNAVVEAMLVREGHNVMGIDCNDEAVALARSKGVNARVEDFMQLPADSLHDVDVVYADGFVGHLFDAKIGLDHFFSKLRDLGLRSGTQILISNDAPQTESALHEQHAKVKGFWYVSPTFLADCFTEYGFSVQEAYTFPYVRPKSGLRHRTICVARV